MWVLQSWALTHDEYELQWICNCPRDSSKDGQTWTKKQGRHSAFGDAMFFLQSVRQDGPMMTERWVCPGWSCMPRRFVVFIAALTSFFALYRFPGGSLCCLRHGRFSLPCIVVGHESVYDELTSPLLRAGELCCRHLATMSLRLVGVAGANDRIGRRPSAF